MKRPKRGMATAMRPVPQQELRAAAAALQGAPA